MAMFTSEMADQTSCETACYSITSSNDGSDPYTPCIEACQVRAAAKASAQSEEKEPMTPQDQDAGISTFMVLGIGAFVLWMFAKG